MAYKTHDFAVGQALTSKALNQMDAQIQKNAEGVAKFNREMVLAELQNLNLTTDGQYIVLKLGDTAIAETEIADVSGVIPCTELRVTENGLSELDAGNTAKIEAIRQPSDCNQSIYFRSDDMNVATVTGSGDVKGIGAGICNIIVRCGSKQIVKKCAVGQIIKPTLYPAAAIYGEGKKDKFNNDAIVLDESNSNMACVFPKEGSTNIVLNEGQKVTVKFNGDGNGFGFRYAYAIALDDADKGLQYTIDWSGRDCVSNVKVLANIFGDTLNHTVKEWSYTATEHCYVVFSFFSSSRPTGGYTQSDLQNIIDNLITIRISPNE